MNYIITRQYKTILFTRDNQNIYYREWSVKDPIAILGIVHGMAEHSKRYEDFAKYLNDHNISVYCMDARGHGLTSKYGKLGHYDKNDWNNIIEDIYYLLKVEKNKNPNIPFFILGHSMGSFLVRNFLNKYKPEIDGAIIMGTGTSDNALLYSFTKLVASLNKPSDKAVFLHRTAFRPYNDRIQNKKTTFDWLSSNPKEIQKYIDDPRCGYCMTNGFYREFMGGMLQISKLERNINLDKNMKVLFLSGKNDPVGNYGVYVMDAFNKYKKSGIEDVKIKLYENMRHEILNEIENEQVYSDILKFIIK